MATMSGIAPMTYAAFTTIPNGTQVKNYGYDQCVAVANLYHQGVLGLPLPSGFGSAYQWWTEFDRQPNLNTRYVRSQTPTPGALFVARGGIYNASDGHIGQVTAVNPDGSFQTIEQNAGTWRYLGRYRRTKGAGILGFLIPIKNPATTSTPSGQKRKDDMARNSGIYWEVKSKPNTIMYANFNLESGAWAPFSNGDGKGAMPSDYNNALATALDTPSWAKVTESHAGAIERACVAVRQGK